MRAMTILLQALKKKKGIRRYIGPKRIVLLVILIVFVSWVWQQYHTGVLSPETILHYHSVHPIRALALFGLIYIVSVVALLPTLPLNLAAGFFWGGILGGVYTALAVTVGSWLSFTASRLLVGQPLTKHFSNQWLEVVQREFNRQGWKFVAFARVNPVIPTGPLNYLLGMTALKHRAFLGATIIFLLPPSIAVAYIGDILQTFTAEQSDVRLLVHRILIASGIFTLLVGLKYAIKLYQRKRTAS